MVLPYMQYSCPNRKRVPISVDCMSEASCVTQCLLLLHYQYNNIIIMRSYSYYNNDTYITHYYITNIVITYITTQH